MKRKIMMSILENHGLESEQFLTDLEKVARIRRDLAGFLHEMSAAIAKAEGEGGKASGRLELQAEVVNLEIVADNLRKGVFRLLVLGDMKRGKSTFLNALLGERLLPSDVNPCTALLTILRYGQDKRVTVYFNNGANPEALDFEAFRLKYTIPPDQSKALEAEGLQAFPDVDHAVVEYPLELLEKGVELIDSPGLNDTESRNAMVLGFIQECHAILFVLSATQAYTLGEQRYLENYIRGRGLAVFFLVNMWDAIQHHLVDESDSRELREAQERVRQVFRTHLREDCRIEGKDLYDRRVFEISSLNALRARLAHPPAPLDGTGFPPFLDALNQFLTRDRTLVEVGRARMVARSAVRRVREAVAQRVPLLESSADELKIKIDHVQPQFESLRQIRDQFVAEIRRTQQGAAGELAESFRSSFTNLDETFEEDFTRYQPELKFLDFLSKNKRREFEETMRVAFEKYLNDKIMAWARTAAEPQLKVAFASLTEKAAVYAVSYVDVTKHIYAELTGEKLRPAPTTAAEVEESPLWQRLAAGAAAVAMLDLAGGVMATQGVFSWQRIALNVGGTIVASLLTYALFGAFLGPIGLTLAGLGIGGWQANARRKKFFEIAKAELQKGLPVIATQGASAIRENVARQFSDYGDQVASRIDEDIKARRKELDNLLAQKQAREIDVRTEIARLRSLEQVVEAQHEPIEQTYDRLIQGED
jgi:GTPase SAR1 family protein